MKVLLLVQREPGSTDTAWVIDAADEYTLDEWNGELPDAMQAQVDKDPENIRRLWLQIPDDALVKPWNVPTVTATEVSA